MLKVIECIYVKNYRMYMQNIGQPTMNKKD